MLDARLRDSAPIASNNVLTGPLTEMDVIVYTPHMNVVAVSTLVLHVLIQ